MCSSMVVIQFLEEKVPSSKDLSMSIQLGGVYIFLMVSLCLFLFLVGEEAPSKELSMSIQLVVFIGIFFGMYCALKNKK